MRARSLFHGRGWSAALAAMRRSRGIVLVVLDFDGTLAPTVPRPDRVRVPRQMAALLTRVTELPRVRVAVLSARPMRELKKHLPVPNVLRVAQYGVEGPWAPPAARRLRIRAGIARLRARLRPTVARHRGAWIEDKRLTLAVHDRPLSGPRRAALLRALRPIVEEARRLGFTVQEGRRVNDFVPSGYDKGRALRALRRRIRPSVTFYFGDSAGDEPAFAALGRTDFPVRVGAGRTAAPYRIRGPGDVARFLRALVALRTGRDTTREVLG